jgi:hypothetical protein
MNACNVKKVQAPHRADVSSILRRLSAVRDLPRRKNRGGTLGVLPNQGVALGCRSADSLARCWFRRSLHFRTLECGPAGTVELPQDRRPWVGRSIKTRHTIEPSKYPDCSFKWILITEVTAPWVVFSSWLGDGGKDCAVVGCGGGDVQQWATGVILGGGGVCWWGLIFEGSDPQGMIDRLLIGALFVGLMWWAA